MKIKLLTLMALAILAISVQTPLPHPPPLCPSWQDVPLCQQVWVFRGWLAYYSAYWSQQFGVYIPSDLMAAVACHESGGDPDLVSSAGAIGVMQVMPYHFAEGEDPFNPRTNISQGIRVYAAILADVDGNYHAALRAYLGGWQNMDGEAAVAYADTVMELYETMRCR